jgi:DUF1680 family protein
VRAVYLYTAMADLARRTADVELTATCETLWRSITRRNLYVTGAIGSTHTGEAFTFDYDLPNETAYAETCAAIGLVFFAERMLALRPRAEFADVMELALYNAVLAGMSQDGKRFFYVNPLEVWPEASLRNPERKHVKHERQPWFGCACCPPNLARLLLSLGRYVCHTDGHTLLIHQYVSGTVPLPGASSAELEIATNYPNHGRIRLVVRGDAAGDVCLALRIPGWCRKFTLESAGTRVEKSPDPDGYLRLRGPFGPEHEIVLELTMEVEALEAHPRIRAGAGKVCLRRGPLVYCLEAIDNGENLSALTLSGASPFETREAPELHTGALKIIAKGFRRSDPGSDAPPYAVVNPTEPASELAELVAVPYYLWGNRGSGEMTVWVRRDRGA